MDPLHTPIQCRTTTEDWAGNWYYACPPCKFCSNGLIHPSIKSVALKVMNTIDWRLVLSTVPLGQVSKLIMHAVIGWLDPTTLSFLTALSFECTESARSSWVFNHNQDNQWDGSQCVCWGMVYPINHAKAVFWLMNDKESFSVAQKCNYSSSKFCVER